MLFRSVEARIAVCGGVQGQRCEPMNRFAVQPARCVERQTTLSFWRENPKRKRKRDANLAISPSRNTF